MTARPESDFATIVEMRDALTVLIDRGLGALPVQILVAPDSTMQALARNLDPTFHGKPAIMIDLSRPKDGRLPVSIISADRLGGANPNSVTTQ
jgi:hypothetical protein